MKPVFLVSVVILYSLARPSLAEQKEIPFGLPAPDGWGTETVQFPLEFAPELDYEGTIDTFDSFVTMEPVSLNLRAEVIPNQRLTRCSQ